MRITTLVILLMMSLLKTNAQNYAEEHYQYDRLHKTMKGYYNRGLYHKAVIYPDSLEGNRYVTAKSYFLFARVYSLSNEFDKTLYHLEHAVKRGVTNTQIEQMYDLDAFRESHLHIIYEMNYTVWHQAYLQKVNEVKFDSLVIKEIQKITDEYAQNIKIRRVDGDDVYEVKDSAAHYATRIRLDSIRFCAIVRLTLKNGFPTRRTIGKEFGAYSRYLRYDMPANYDENGKDWQRIKAMIFTEIGKGTIYPFYYAAIEDYMRYRKRRPQWYGTMNYIYKSSIDYTNGVQFENPEELNVRRRSVGLCSIQLEMWSEARELPESLKGVIFK
jgi:hypothetical protein